ncbi:MAG: hypothetical protein K1060chlam4_00808 [Candidatus Anoxychlamydiales bacterium]|nr:hypothetical protein [Candidatus Anoxychlamydiales bacterium]
MTTITKITPTFYRCSETHGRTLASVPLIASTWNVLLSDGSTKKYNITLSPDKLDPDYDSRKDSHKNPEDLTLPLKPNYAQPKDYYIQIDDSPKFVDKLFKPKLSEESFDKATTDPKNQVLCPKNGKGKPLFFYVISPKGFEKIPKEDFENILNTQEKIDTISTNTINITKNFFSSNKVSEEELADEKTTVISRIKLFDLDQFESKLLFHELFEKHLISYIQEKDSSIRDGRFKKATETTPLVKDQTSLSCCIVV